MEPASFQASAIPAGREQVATLIVTKFADAGYSGVQQIAALANAIRESALNPAATSAQPGDGVGLFQLNMHVGLGKGFTQEQLSDPGTNIDIILNAAKQHDDFKNAAALDEAVGVFVRKISRPADPAAEVAKQVVIAKGLMAA